jgi:hypothetical protein
VHIEYEQSKVIELPEFQTGIFGDSCTRWVLLLHKHSASSSCNIDGGCRGNDGQTGEGIVIILPTGMAIEYDYSLLRALQCQIRYTGYFRVFEVVRTYQMWSEL